MTTKCNITRIKMAEQEEMELISPTNASNMHLHVEQLSQKTDWKLAKRSLTTKAARKISM